MLIRTHLAIAVFAILLMIPHISNRFLFVAVVLIATFIPDIDSGFSTLGKEKISKVLQIFTKHRGIIHSFTLCIIISLILAFFLPQISLAFFLGYALHLITDSFTKEGITPFWPYSRTSSGYFKTGTRVETSIFLTFIILDLILLVVTVQKII